MISLNEQQMTAFKQNDLNLLIKEIMQYLRNTYHEQTYSIFDEPLKQHIKTGISNAQEYGITKKRDIRRYLEYSLLYGWDFDRDTATPWIKKLLAEPLINGAAKMDQIEQADGQPF